MKTFTKKFFGLLIGCMIVVTPLLSLTSVAHAGGLVPDCGKLVKTGEVDGNGQPILRDDKGTQVASGGTQRQITVVAQPCGFDSLMELINNVVHFLLIDIAAPFVALILCYAGFLMLTAGGSSEKVTKAKHILKNVIFGYIIALAAWLIINTILKTLGFTGPIYLING